MIIQNNYLIDEQILRAVATYALKSSNFKSINAVFLSLPDDGVIFGSDNCVYVGYITLFDKNSITIRLNGIPYILSNYSPGSQALSNIVNLVAFNNIDPGGSTVSGIQFFGYQITRF